MPRAASGPHKKNFPPPAAPPVLVEREAGVVFRRPVENSAERSAGKTQMWQRKRKEIQNRGFDVKSCTAESENRIPKRIEKQKTGAETTDEPPIFDDSILN